MPNRIAPGRLDLQFDPVTGNGSCTFAGPFRADYTVHVTFAASIENDVWWVAIESVDPTFSTEQLDVLEIAIENALSKEFPHD